MRADAPALILASGSRTRATMLRRAGLAFERAPADIDEAAVKRDLRAEGAAAERIAATLAGMKAARIAGSVAATRPDALILGADQILDLDGALLDKPPDRAAAAAQLRRLSGRSHRLVSAAVLLRDGAQVWSCTDSARLTLRPLSEAFIAAYLDAAGADILESVGAYRLEGPGAQLFSAVEGDFFTILGLPLLPLLDALRGRGMLAA